MATEMHEQFCWWIFCLTNCVSDMMPVMFPDMPPVISILATDFFLNTLTVVCAPTESCVEYFAICSLLHSAGEKKMKCLISWLLRLVQTGVFIIIPSLQYGVE